MKVTGFFLALCVAGLMACTPESTPTATPAYTILSEAELLTESTVPVPEGDVVLTITGNITHTNVEDTLQLDMATLEQLQMVEYSVEDKMALGRVASFQGVLLSDVLDLAGMSEDAEVLYTIAINDYTVEIPVEDVRNYPVLVATRADNERMSIENYGPIRIIYPYEAYDLDPITYDPRWIWQLVQIDVR